MIIGMVRDLPLKENIIKFKIEFLKYDKKWESIPGHVLALPVSFNTESVLVKILTSEGDYPIIKPYRYREGPGKEIKVALPFRWILGWETITNPQDELPLHIGAQIKTRLYEDHLKGINNGTAPLLLPKSADINATRKK